MTTDEMAVLLGEAVKLAVDAHTGQLYDDEPYIFHPLRVMLQLKSPGLQVVGVLHDVLEDHPEFRGQVESLLIPSQLGLWMTLQAVTRGEFGIETYKNYIRRVLAAGMPARMVKLADLADNSNPERETDAGTRGMIADRYVWASALLLTGDEEYADARRKQAKNAWKHRGEHPGKFVLTPECLEVRTRLREEE